MEEEKERENEIDTSQEEIVDNMKDLNPNATIQYGDIIEIHSPANPDFHEQGFFVRYVDENLIRLTNVANMLSQQLKLDENGTITDESIQEIRILSRSEEKGYARQNELLPQKWVDIYFSGDFPTTITGEITDLIEDMIEVTTYPDLDVIYIDFEYKGVPLDLPIEKITIKPKPASLRKIATLRGLGDDLEEGEEYEFDADDETATLEYSETGDTILTVSDNVAIEPDLKETMKPLYAKANKIVFGEHLEDIVQRVEIPEKDRKYGIDLQVNDLLDELLSTIPSYERTDEVMDNIHLFIERFKELRQEFSNFDETGNVIGAKVQGPFYKPLLENLLHMKSVSKWILPNTTMRRKLYGLSNETSQSADISVVDIVNDLETIEQAQTNYQENRVASEDPRYDILYKSINDLMTPYDLPTHNTRDKLLYFGEVSDNIEAIVSSNDDFNSTTISNNKMARRKFVIQRYNLAQTSKKPNSSKHIYKPTPLTDNDMIAIQSLVFLPEPIIAYSRAQLPSTDISTRVSISQNPPFLFRCLKQNTRILSYIVDQFDKDIDYDKLTQETKTELFANFQEFILDRSLANKPDKYEKFLKSIIPNNAVLIRFIRKYMKDDLTVIEMMKQLEPFSIYKDAINYKQFGEMRTFIKDSIKEIRQKQINSHKTFVELRNLKSIDRNGKNETNTIEKTLASADALFDIFVRGYLKQKSNSLKKPSGKTSAEVLFNLYEADHGKLYMHLLQLAADELITNGDFMRGLENAEPAIDDMGDIERVLPNDCTRRYLTKKYTSLKDLQKDNAEVDVFYDKDYDETPYHLLKKYKAEAEKAGIEEEAFSEFLQENLIQKHDCPVSFAEEMATTLILGKKRVVDGEYAMLVITPKLRDEAQLTQSIEEQIKSETEIRTKTQYFKRAKNYWVAAPADDIDESTFIDNNTLFCNIKQSCNKNKSNRVCETVDETGMKFRNKDKKRLLDEFDRRYEMSVEEIKKQLEGWIKQDIRVLARRAVLQEIQGHRANNYAHLLGNMANTDETLQSPHSKLRDLILAQEDFVRRQSNIMKFVNKYCRDPMVQELKESERWLYCVDTNTKLLPLFMKELAEVFCGGENYQQKQLDICRLYGVLSDDGDSIVDKHSGYAIRKIDLASEEGSDIAAEMKNIVHEIMMKDTSTTISEVLSKADKIFENEMAEMNYRVIVTLATVLNIPFEMIEEKIMRISTDVIHEDVMTEEAYLKFSQKLVKKTGKAPIAYLAYRNQRRIVIVSAVLLVTVQTTVPPFTKQSRSFRGFPIDGGVEDTTGIRTIAGALNKIKSSISIWEAVQKLSVTTISKLIKEVIEKYLIIRDDVSELYRLKKEYESEHASEFIPPEHSVEKWTSFMPPLVELRLTKNLQTVSDEHRKELIDQMREGKKTQFEILSSFHSKIREFTFGIIEAINTIVKSKDLLLKTASKVPFLENACCNDVLTGQAIEYFIRENEVIGTYVKIIDKLGAVLTNIRHISNSPIIYHAIDNSIFRPEPSADFSLETIYSTIIDYCNFDRDLPIPDEYTIICSEKLPDYKASWPLTEKIAYLKRSGKNYEKSTLDQLMKIVNKQNQIEISMDSTKPNMALPIAALLDLLVHLESINSTVVAEPLRRHLNDVLTHHDPTIMVAEDNEFTQRLKDYVITANENMFVELVDFFDRHGNLTPLEMNKTEDFLKNISEWDLLTENTDNENIYTVATFIKNSIYSMVKTNPEIILNSAKQDHVPIHWGLSKFHQGDVKKFVDAYYSPLQKFKGDEVIHLLLKETQDKLVDLYSLIQLIPINTPIQKDETIHYSLFDEETLFHLLKHLWYCVLLAYIHSTDDVDLVKRDIYSHKMSRRGRIIEGSDPLSYIGAPVEEFGNDDMDELMDVEITTGTKEDLKRRTANLLVAMLQIDRENKKSLDMPYTKISQKTRASREEEKKRFTDFFKNMDSDELRVEDMKKLYKLGRWSVGLQKGVVQYDKEMYDAERREMIDRMDHVDEPMDEQMVVRDVGEMEADEAADVDQFYEDEANNIEGLDEDYMDGDYYGEDDNDGF